MLGNDIRVIILGAAGFIGYHIANKLSLINGYKIVLIDNFVNSRLDYQFSTLIKRNNVEFKNLDLTTESSYLGLFEQGDIVFNCAAINGTQNFYTKPTQVIKNSAISSILAVEFATRADVKKYIYFGSSESYAGGLSLGLIGLPTNELVPLVIPDVENVRWSYAASKTLGEIATIANANQFNLNYLILRLHNIYGPRMGIKHVIPDLILKFKKCDGGVYGLGETRTFMFIDDFVEIVLKLVFNSQVKGNCIYNIGSDKEISIFELAKLVKEVMNSDVDIVSRGSFLGSVKRRCPDTTLLKSQISFTETDLAVGISKTIDWYLAHSI